MGGRNERAKASLLLAAVLAGSGLLAGGQERTNPAETNALTTTNAAVDPVELSRASEAGQTNEVAQAEDFSPTNGVAPADGISAVQPSSRPQRPRAEEGQASQTQRDRRRDRDQASTPSDTAPSSEGRSGQTGASSRATSPASGTKSPARLDYSAFRLITERNIFDPNRAPRRANREKPRTVESFSLVGVMSYEKGTFAFFDGTSSAFRKALKQTDTIAGYKVESIAANAVKLLSGTNELELSVGSQMRREDGGEWRLSAQPETYAATSSSAAPAGSTDSAAPLTGADSDMLKKLAQRREQE